MDTLGGYRLVRKLGDGARAEVFLGHPLGSPVTGLDEPHARPVAIKVFREGVVDASIMAEIEALSRASGEHSLRLVDVTTGPEGAQALILERLTGGTLARLLRDRPRLRLGEAITVLAPLALAMTRLHGAGVVHAAVRQDAVLFDGAGAPVLCCFGHAFAITPGQPPALLDAVPGVILDVRAFAGLAHSVLDAVDHPSARSLADWVESSPSLDTDAWFGQLADRLFDLTVPEPIDFAPAEVAVTASLVPGRLVTGEPVPSPEPPRRGLPDWAARLLPDDAAAVLERARSAAGLVRTRVWVAAGAVGLALVAAFVLVPQGGSGAANGPSAAPAASATAWPGPDAAPVAGDDPVAALVALLETRAGCIRDLSVLCLDSVGQAGSSALADDQALVRSLQAGAESPNVFEVDAAQVTIDERLGDSAILRLGDVADNEPASILLMKGEAGWRIRDYLEK
jgi:hypothetical protein